MRPIAKDFQKLKFVIGGYSEGESILWLWYRNNEFLYASYCGKSHLSTQLRTQGLECAFDTGEIGLRGFVKNLKASPHEKSSSRYTYSLKDCVAPLLKTHQIFSLWEALKVHTWQSSYFAPILDGTQWELTYETNGRTYRIDGSNAYPQQWERFMDFLTLFTPKFKEFRDYIINPYG